MPIGNPAGYGPPPIEEYDQFKGTQEAYLQRHAQYKKMLQNKQQQVQMRQADLTTADRLYKVLDPQIGKPAKQFLMRELATNMEIDPKSETFKNISQLFTSLDPDSAQALKNTLSQAAENGKPGQINEMVKGLMSGRVSVNDLVSMVKKTQPPPIELDTGQSTDQPASGDGSAGGPNLAQSSASDPRVVQPFQEGATAPVRSFEENRTVLPGDQQTNPQLVGALGIDASKQFRNNDLVQSGYRIPFDPKEQGELAQTINTRVVGLTGTIREAGLMTDLFAPKDGKDRPEVLGALGGLVRGIQSTVRQAEGLLNLIQPGVESAVDINDSTTQQLASQAANRLAEARGLDVTAEDSARIQSMALGLAYRMAIARDIPGNRLTNAIINQHLVQIGQSASPDQFKAVLSDTVTSLVSEFDDTMRRQVGVEGSSIIARQLSDDDISMIAQNAEMLPNNLVAAVRDEYIARKDENRDPAVEPSSPTIQEEQQTLGRAEMAEKSSKIEQREFQNRLSLAQEVRARRAEQRSEAREERIVQQQETSNKLARERFEFQQEKYEEQEEQQRSDRIRDAFMRFGAAIAQSGGGGSIGVSIPSGGQQNAAAFNISNAPQRIPPRIPGRNAQ